MDHDLVLTGPYPYFSTAEIWFGQCSCGSWESGKDSVINVHKRHADHVKSKRANEKSVEQLSKSD